MNSEIEKALGKCKSKAAYDEAAARLAQLKTDLTSAEKALQDGIRLEGQRDTETAVLRDAERLLSGERASAFPNVDVAALDRDVKVTRAAVELQKAEFNRCRRILHEELGPYLRPLHEKLVAAIGAGVTTLSNALVAEEAFRRMCVDNDLGFGGMRPLGGFNNTRLDVQYSEGEAWMFEAKEHGYRV